MKRRWSIVGAMVVLVLAEGATAADFVLIENGVPKAQIVLGRHANDTEKLAAAELALYLKKSTGVELPVISSRWPKVGMAQIRLGTAAESMRRELDLSSLAFDGFVMDCTENRLVLAGNVPKGTLNAVYAFLEDYVGVRWYMPTDLGENVPRHTTVTVPLGRRRVEPRFVCRQNHTLYRSAKGAGEVWERRVRITNNDLDVPFNRYSHNIDDVIPRGPSAEVQEFIKTHPDYYPLFDGERYLPEGADQRWQPCTTHPDVIRLAIEAAGEWFAAHPEANSYALGINDGNIWCECEDCRALDIDPERTFNGAKQVSERYYTFVRQVAEAIAKTHPGKYITCIAYGAVLLPPRNFTLPTNVVVCITQDVGQWHDPVYKAKDKEAAAAWAKAAGGFMAYDYTGLDWLMPRVYPHAMAESLRFYADHGAVGAVNEANPVWWYTGPMLYLRARLMWDPTLDPDAVLTEYYDGFFGPGSAGMKTMYSVFERCMMKKRPGWHFEGLSHVTWQLNLWDRADLEECREALGAARRAVAGQEPYSARVELLVARGFRLAQAMLEEYWQAGELRRLVAEGGSADKLLDGAQKMAQRTRERKAAWTDLHTDRAEPLASRMYQYVDEVPQRLNSWLDYLDQSLTAALAAAAARADAPTEERVRALLPSLLTREQASDVEAMLWAREHSDAPNLCKNADFEETGQPDAPKGPEAVSASLPLGWDMWAVKPEEKSRMTISSTGGRSAPRCLRIQGVTYGVWIQTQTVRPGERYYVSVWTRRVRDSAGAAIGADPARINLLVDWEDDKGRKLGEIPQAEVSSTESTAEWCELALVFTVPDGVGRARVQFGAEGQAADYEVLFDDVRLVRLPETEDQNYEKRSNT